MAAALDAPGQVVMNIGDAQKPLFELTVKDVGVWLQQQGLGHLSESFVHNKINGKYLVTLTQSDLEKMGVEIIGDQKAVLDELTELKRAARRVLRDQVLWKGKEKIWDNCCQEIAQTCCFVCPIPPARYTLTNQNLKITEVEIFRCCGSVRCACCGVTAKQNNLDLNYIKDVDYAISRNCCDDMASVVVEMDTGSSSECYTLKLPGSEAPEAVNLIKNAIEDAKMRRERGAKDAFA